MSLEMSPAGEKAAQQDGGIHGREFGIPNSFSRVNVCEMVDKESMCRHLLPQKAQSSQHPVPNIGRRNKFPLLTDAKSGQAKSCGRNTGHDGIVIFQAIASIPDQTSLHPRLIPEVLEVSLLHFLQKIVVLLRESARCWRRLGGLRRRRFRDRRKDLAGVENSQQSHAACLKEQISSRKAVCSKVFHLHTH